MRPRMGWLVALCVLVAAPPSALGQSTDDSQRESASASSDEQRETGSDETSGDASSEKSSGAPLENASGQVKTAVRIPSNYAANFGTSSLLALPLTLIAWLVGGDVGGIVFSGIPAIAAHTSVTHLVGNQLGGSGGPQAFGAAIGTAVSWGVGWWVIFKKVDTGTLEDMSLGVPLLIWSAGPVVGFEVANLLVHSSDRRRAERRPSGIRVTPTAALAPDGSSGFVGVSLDF